MISTSRTSQNLRLLFSHLGLLPSPPIFFWSPVRWQVPEGLSRRLAPILHLVDAAARMQLIAEGQVAAIVPFDLQKKLLLTLYKGEAALAARRDAMISM